MTCNDYKEQLPAFLAGELNAAEASLLQTHLAECSECSAELSLLQEVWYAMAALPTEAPSATMQADFNTLLKNYRQELPHGEGLFTRISNRFRHLWRFQPRMPLAYGLLLVVLGLGLGYLVRTPAPASTPPVTASAGRIDSLATQVANMKQTLMMTLLENPSASERIRAVNYTYDINTADNKIIKALLTTLNNDPNVNVRLATLDALAKFAKEPMVREGLIQSITNQESPIVQTAIADLMVKLQEKRSVKELQQLLNKKDVNEMVKTKIEESIHQLI